MARKPADKPAISSVVDDLLETVNRYSTSSDGYLAGDLAKHSWGVPIPSLAFQWLIGGSNILPCQRYCAISGEKKSLKSTLQVEIGNWFIQDGGVHLYLDTEKKTSDSMVSGMSVIAQTAHSRVYKQISSVGEWQTLVTKLVEKARTDFRRPPGSRVPVWIVIDSLTGVSTEDEDRNLRSEGSAAERGYPVIAAAITKYLQTLNLLGTTVSIGWVQHLKKSMDQSAGYGGPEMRETGPSASSFATSILLRVTKSAAIRAASHDSAPNPDQPVEGYTVWLKTELSCLGPDHRSIPVDVLWQYRTDEAGRRQQVMWYDWDGSLGRILHDMKYSDRWKPKLYKNEIDQLNEILPFTEETTTTINCKKYGLEKASFSAFGKAIRGDAATVEALTKFLNIQQFPTVQTAEIDFEAGDLAAKKGKFR